MTILHYGLILGCMTAVLSAPATYDQRQTGDLNVQIHLKDLQVLALVDSDLLDDYTEYDYFYDYADFTIKPGTKPTTSSPGTTVKPWNTWPTNPPSTQKIDVTNSTASSSANATVTSPSSDVASVNSTTDGTTVSLSLDNDKPENVAALAVTDAASIPSNETRTSPEDKLDDSSIKPDSATVENISDTEEKPTFHDDELPPLARKRCRSGFSPDGKGRCRRLNRRRLSFIPLALKFASKWSGDVSDNTKNLS